MPHSHHSHSGQFCKHAKGILEDVVKQAIAKNFQLFGLTEHVPRYREIDLYPEEQGLTVSALKEQFASFLEEARRLKSHYAPKINLLIGLETEYITTQDLDELAHILSQHQHTIDYIVGSIHHVGEIPFDFDEPAYLKAVQAFAEEGNPLSEDAGLERFLSAYFDAQYELFQRFKPEIVGHMDLCRLYAPDLEFTNYPSAWEKIERNVIYAISYGALFEINAAAFRKGWNTASPGKDVAKLILKHGGRFALSDDSHSPRTVGLNYDRTFGYLKSLGITEIWYLEQSDSPNAAGRKVRPRKLENWSEHQFWQGFGIAK